MPFDAADRSLEDFGAYLLGIIERTWHLRDCLEVILEVLLSIALSCDVVGGGEATLGFGLHPSLPPSPLVELHKNDQNCSGDERTGNIVQIGPLLVARVKKNPDPMWPRKCHGVLGNPLILRNN